MNKINQKDLRRFLFRMGFPHAMDWSEEKLRKMAVGLAAQKQLSVEDIPKQYLGLYEDLKRYAKTGAYIDWAPPQRKKENVYAE